MTRPGDCFATLFFTLLYFISLSRFFELLDSVEGPPLRLITTSYLPANARDAGAAEQIITVERLTVPPAEDRRRSSQLLDVMEVLQPIIIAPSRPSSNHKCL